MRHWLVIPLTFAVLFCFGQAVSAATLYVDAAGTNPTPPYADWPTAATNIQDAIDAASAADTVLVTNGVYTNGGKIMAGDLLNRVAVNKALTVQSVNGPSATIIQGAGANGPVGLRCAWLTNGALLSGFTLQRGSTRSSGDINTLGSGGGVWCASSNAIVMNCVIRSNGAFYMGGGVYQGTLNNCSLSLDNAQTGGGAYGSMLNNCVLSNNTATHGGGARGGILNNCAIVGNLASDAGGLLQSTSRNCTITGNSASIAAGLSSGSAFNCIVYSNGVSNSANYSSVVFSYSCSTPLPPGAGNISDDPQLLADGVHLASTSPCRGKGTNSVVSGTDIDGQSWANPPSMGCDEWQPAPVIAVQPRIRLANLPIGFTISAVVAGSEPFTCLWSRKGVAIENDTQYSFAHATNLSCNSVGLLVAGSYQVVISNGFGMTTSAVVRAAVHCVDAVGTNPTPPYSAWATAATNIQDAITVTSAGEIVLVTNGVYGAGGKSMDGAITNRIALDKPIAVQSVTGPFFTFIQGYWNPSVTNGPSAIRCAWLTNGAVLGGFTLRGGATRQVTLSPNQQMNGGGIWGASTNAIVVNCIIATNLASYQGGGAYQVTLNNCSLLGNRAVGSGSPGAGVANAGTGGGAVGCTLNNCVVSGNSADQSSGGGTSACNLNNSAITKNSAYLYGGGVYGGSLINCAISGNISGGYGAYGAAVASATLTNCISYGNSVRGTFFNVTNYYACAMAYCDSDPLPDGAGNIATDPQFLADGIHLAVTSPCRGAGSNVALGTDLDGQPWAIPPAIGCDEWLPAPVVIVQPRFQIGLGSRFSTLTSAAAGQEPFAWSWSKDGNAIQDDAHYVSSSTPNLGINNFDSPDLGAYQVIVSNAFGVVTSQLAQVVIHFVNAAATNPLPPYSTWKTAASNIQDAVDVAVAGEIVLVTNGVYAAGGKVMYGDLTNRVALDKALTVVGMNGSASTIIQGAWDPATNGPAAVRCAWLTDGAILAGFTLQGGATRASGSPPSFLCSGGGVWCVANTPVVANCLIRGNAASSFGGGVYRGTINNCAINNNVLFATSPTSGGGAYGSVLNNCTVAHNTAGGNFGTGGGLYFGNAQNSIIYGNNAAGFANNYSSPMTYCDTTPANAGLGNISTDPQLLDDFHIAITSPCRGAGNAFYTTESDIDSEAWTNPPSMGCDEPWPAGLVGPLSVSLAASDTKVYANHSLALAGHITGRASRVAWDFGDGTTSTNLSSTVTHAWQSTGPFNVVFAAYNSDNSGGVSANLWLNVIPVLQPQLTPEPMTTNGFQFQFYAQSNLSYRIQRATNLVPPIAWQLMQFAFTNADGLIVLKDSTLSNGSQFYRVIVQ